MLTYWGLKETGTSYDQIFGFPDNQWKKYFAKSKKNPVKLVKLTIDYLIFFFICILHPR